MRIPAFSMPTSLTCPADWPTGKVSHLPCVCVCVCVCVCTRLVFFTGTSLPQSEITVMPHNTVTYINHVQFVITVYLLQTNNTPAVGYHCHATCHHHRQMLLSQSDINVMSHISHRQMIFLMSNITVKPHATVTDADHSYN